MFYLTGTRVIAQHGDRDRTRTCNNTTPSAVHNYCPFELVFGKTATSFDDTENVQPLYNVDNYAKEMQFRLQTARKRAQQIIEEKKIFSKIYADKNQADIDIEIGDKVLVTNEAGHKLDNRYLGPYLVVDIDDKNNFYVKDSENKTFKFHKSRLKSFN